MGLLRLLLALSVLFEHTGGIYGYWMIGGPLAVQCFFIVSGFYMGLVLNERYDRPALNRTFWINRAIRIYAIYFLFLALYVAVFAMVQARTGHSPFDPYMEAGLPGWQKAGLALLNLTVIGQDLPLWLGIDDGALVWTTHGIGYGGLDAFHFMMIPVAWSLSLELMFYALAPFIARRPAWQIAALMLVSLLARVSAAFGLGLAADPFSYRFFPFELALFLAGVLAYKAWAANRTAWQRPAARALALALPVAILAYPWLLGAAPDDAFFVPQRIGLLALLACALPAIHGWSERSRRDRALGELSYPLYLGHLLVLGLASGAVADPALRTLAASALSIGLAWLVVRFADLRIEAWRRRLAERAGASD